MSLLDTCSQMVRNDDRMEISANDNDDNPSRQHGRPGTDAEFLLPSIDHEWNGESR